MWVKKLFHLLLFYCFIVVRVWIIRNGFLKNQTNLLKLCSALLCLSFDFQAFKIWRTSVSSKHQLRTSQTSCTSRCRRSFQHRRLSCLNINLRSSFAIANINFLLTFCVGVFVCVSLRDARFCVAQVRAALSSQSRAVAVVFAFRRASRYLWGHWAVGVQSNSQGKDCQSDENLKKFHFESQKLSRRCRNVESR